MARLKRELPFVHPDCEIGEDCVFGAYVEIGRASRLGNAQLGYYSHSGLSR